MNIKTDEERQVIFATIVKHLLTQNSKSMCKIDFPFEREVCAYRGDDGKKCAVGVLIEDKDYDIYMEGRSFTRLPIEITEKICDINDAKTLYLLLQLQHIHDSVNVECWEEKLKTFAEKYGYTMPI